VLKKSITFEDLNGQQVTEDYYFHLTRANLVEMQMSTNDTYEKDGEVLEGMQAKMQRIIDAGDGAQIMATFKDLILSSYGKKSPDGRQFIKTPELRQEFEMSEAYSTLFMELCTDAQAAADFVNGIVPKGMDQEIAKLQQDKPQTPPPLEAPVGRPADGGPGVPRVLTRAEVTEMDSAELSHLLATGQAVIGGEG
jgi:hypothetical protein